MDDAPESCQELADRVRDTISEHQEKLYGRGDDGRINVEAGEVVSALIAIVGHLLNKSEQDPARRARAFAQVVEALAGYIGIEAKTIQAGAIHESQDTRH